MTSPMPAFSCHAPAGERISLGQMRRAVSSRELNDPQLSAWTPFGSGTMALAAALCFSRSKTPDATRVILPAYSCPDIAAAARYAGMEIEFLDLAPGQVGPDPAVAGKALSQTGKIGVLVDLFGTQSDLSAIRKITRRSGAILIHDRAQSLAGPGITITDSPDFVIVSRGRGKPATLLGGGAVWARDHESFSTFSAATFPLEGWNMWYAALRAQLYNCAIHPIPYNAITQLPFLHLGETRLKDLQAVTRLPREWLVHSARQLSQQLAGIEGRKSRTQALAAIVHDLSYAIPPDALQTADREGLNRLPVLCRDAQQAAWLANAGKRLGISTMYGKTLPEFLGMGTAEAAAAFPEAWRFARTLVTIPTHTRFDADARSHLRRLLQNAR
jgi:dTDP-4-amino-4,6-dideoxygalactose transaminase